MRRSQIGGHTYIGNNDFTCVVFRAGLVEALFAGDHRDRHGRSDRRAGGLSRVAVQACGNVDRQNRTPGEVHLLNRRRQIVS